MAQTQTGTGALAAYFEDDADARQAVEALHDAGFTSAHIGVAHRGASATTNELDSTPSASTEYNSNPTAAEQTAGESKPSVSSHLGEKATSTWEKIKNAFHGNEAEPYADERGQGDLARRELTRKPDDFSRFDDKYDLSDLHLSFTSLNVPEDRSRYFSHRFTNSERGAVLTVNAGARLSDAESILTQYGGDLGSDADQYDYSEVSGLAEETETRKPENNIQLLGEVLRVHKDRVSRGEVTLRKEIITETQTVQVPVTREELVIERRAIEGSTSVSGTVGESEIRIPLTEERASIDKATVVREEISVSKKPVSEVRDLSGEVRREELVVDDPTKKTA